MSQKREPLLQEDGNIWTSSVKFAASPQGWALAVFLIWILILKGVLSASKDEFVSVEQFGQLGDSFGTFNALITSLTLICILYSIKQQQHEIEMNKREAECQRRESLDRFRLEKLRARLESLPSLISIERQRCSFYTGKGPFQILPRTAVFDAIPSIEFLAIYLENIKPDYDFYSGVLKGNSEIKSDDPDVVVKAKEYMVAYQCILRLKRLITELDEVYAEIGKVDS